jgi:sodium transport system ATP-binding protein
MLEVRNLHMRFGAVKALTGVSLSAADGRITGLVGENGAGKTTTLNIVSGLHEPSQGSVVVNGVSTTPQDRRARIGALLDQRGLYSRLTARENVEYFAALRGFEGGELTRRTRHALTTVGLESVAHRRTEGFSQGERMKVALARAIVHSPQHLLLDEPTNGLDVPSARGFKAALRRMRDDGVCVVLSSHMIEDLGTLCDSVVIIAGGRVVAQGSAADLCRQSGSTTLEESFMVFNGGQGD